MMDPRISQHALKDVQVNCSEEDVQAVAVELIAKLCDAFEAIVAQLAENGLREHTGAWEAIAQERASPGSAEMVMLLLIHREMGKRKE